MPKGFFDDNACPTLAIFIQTNHTEIMNDFGILAWRSRKIKDTIAGGATLLINGIQQRAEFLIAFYIIEVGLQVTNTRSKTLPDLWVDRLLTAVLIDRFERLFAELIVAVGTPRESYN